MKLAPPRKAAEGVKNAQSAQSLQTIPIELGIVGIKVRSLNPITLSDTIVSGYLTDVVDAQWVDVFFAA